MGLGLLMTTKPLSCAKCGAPVTADKVGSLVVCEYCRTTLLIEDQSTKAADEQLAAKRKEPKEKDADDDNVSLREVGNQAEKAGKVITDSLKSGASIAASAAQVVDRVGNVLFWTKIGLIALLIISLLGCCVIPALIFTRVLG